jgi:hypothetical protein
MTQVLPIGARVIARFAVHEGPDRRARAGASVIEALLGLSPNVVGRWRRERAKGGTGGHVPAQYHEALLWWSDVLGLDLTPDDFHLTADERRAWREAQGPLDVPDDLATAFGLDAPERPDRPDRPDAPQASLSLNGAGRAA